MTPKEKAEDLIDSFVRDGYDLVMSDRMAKWCALFLVDEILNELYNDVSSMSRYTYWQEVKQEIKQL
jgi:hypothetical protein